MRDMLSGEKTRIPLVLLTQAQYEVNVSEKSLGAEIYREIDVSNGSVPKTNTPKMHVRESKTGWCGHDLTENPHVRI